MTGSTAAAPSSLRSAFRTMPPTRVPAAHFQLEAEDSLGYLRALDTMTLTHGIPLSLYCDRHVIFQRNDAHWTLAEQFAGNNLPRNSVALWTNSAPADPRLFSPGQRPHRTRLAHLARPLVSELYLAQAATLAKPR